MYVKGAPGELRLIWMGYRDADDNKLVYELCCNPVLNWYASTLQLVGKCFMTSIIYNNHPTWSTDRHVDKLILEK